MASLSPLLSMLLSGRRDRHGYPCPSAAIVLCFTLLQACASSSGNYDGVLTVTSENDVITGSDNSYSNGFAITWTSDNIENYATDSAINKWTRFWDFLPQAQTDNGATYVAWTAAQEIHTAEDISMPDPPADDPPYAGLLYLDSLIYTLNERLGQAWTLRTGIVGPASQADRTQIEFHKLINAEDPKGWDTQLPNEPVINVGYTAAFNWLSGAGGNGANWRLTPLVNAELGTYATALGAGVLFEYGWNLPDALGASSIGQGLNSAMTVGIGPSNGWATSFYAGIGGYAVGHYLPLDGTVFRDSRSGNRDPYVGQASMGFALRRQRLVVGFGISIISGSFHDTRYGMDYGTVTIAWFQ